VPEFVQGQQFKLTWTQLLDEVDEALALGHKIKPISAAAAGSPVGARPRPMRNRVSISTEPSLF
jgi:hypothetical protein